MIQLNFSGSNTDGSENWRTSLYSELFITDGSLWFISFILLMHGLRKIVPYLSLFSVILIYVLCINNRNFVN